MNIRPYQIINKKGDRKYGMIHILVPALSERKTLCGHYIDRKYGYWEETTDPVTCPRCLRFYQSKDQAIWENNDAAGA
jgi:hypothetical protein